MKPKKQGRPFGKEPTKPKSFSFFIRQLEWIKSISELHEISESSIVRLCVERMIGEENKGRKDYLRDTKR